MAKEFSGLGEPAKTLAILWGKHVPPKRGPKQGLTIDRIVTVATRIADADLDLDRLSMRRVAEELGVGTMSLYTYVPSKAELVDAMLDAAYGELLDGDPPDAPGWRERLRAVADANWALYARHPWMLQVFTGRPTLGPNAIEKYERELTAIDGIGLSDTEMDAVLTLVQNHVEGIARRKLESRQAEQRSGISDQQWWAAVEPLLAEVVDPARFPIGTRVGSVAGKEYDAPHSPEHAYEFGLERLLDGIAALLEP